MTGVILAVLAVVVVAAYVLAVVAVAAIGVIEEAAELSRMVSRSLNLAHDIAAHPQCDGSPS